MKCKIETATVGGAAGALSLLAIAMNLSKKPISDCKISSSSAKPVHRICVDMAEYQAVSIWQPWRAGPPMCTDFGRNAAAEVT
jgi:hypothetical protein